MSRLLASVRLSLPLLAGFIVGLVAASVAVVAASGPFVNIQIASVSNGDTVKGVIQLVATADGEGVSSVQFQLDGQDLGGVITGGPCMVTWNTGSVREGPHSLGVFARDSRGTALFVPDISVQVMNDVPRRTSPR